MRTPVLCALLTLLPWPVIACQCQTSFSVCNEVGASDLVFIGTVESIEPTFLSRWNVNNRSSLRTLNNVYMDAQQSQSADALLHLKDAYLKAFPDLAEDAKHELQAAKTISAVTSLFYSTLNRGMRVRFRVKTLFKHEADDDDPKDNDKDDEADSFDVWTPFGDCGIEFQAGETYLVYANNDESSGLLSTTHCTRTRRLSDAGEDLAYLFFLKDNAEESARLEGFATTDEHYQLDLSKMRDPESVRSPVPGVVIELQSDHLTRYTEADSKGHYVLDGLAKGDYKVSVFPPQYPLNTRVLAEPRPVHIEAKSCSLQILLLPKAVSTNIP